MPTFSDVVQAWRVADPKHIHPTREHESEVAYWESGKPQAQLVADLLNGSGTVLDFACGDGRIAIPMAKLGLTVYACDASPEMLERLEHNALVQGAEGIELFQSDGTDLLWHLPQPDVHIDAVNARAVFIHHAHADVERIVPNLAQLLKPGGFFICDWPVGGHHERVDWIDVTTWTEEHRQTVADAAGLTLVSEGEPRVRPSVWVKK